MIIRRALLRNSSRTWTKTGMEWWRKRYKMTMMKHLNHWICQEFQKICKNLTDEQVRKIEGFRDKSEIAKQYQRLQTNVKHVFPRLRWPSQSLIPVVMINWTTGLITCWNIYNGLPLGLYTHALAWVDQNWPKDWFQRVLWDDQQESWGGRCCGSQII